MVCVVSVCTHGLVGLVAVVPAETHGRDLGTAMPCTHNEEGRVR